MLATEIHLSVLAIFLVNLADKRVIVVKSANNFSAGHEAIAGRFIYIKTPGEFDPLTADYQKINRDIWPFNDTNSQHQQNNHQSKELS